MSQPTEAVKERDSDRFLSHSPERLRYRRKAAGLTITELAEKIGRSRAMVSMYENSQHSPNPGTLAKLAAALGCSTTDLMPDQCDEALERFVNATADEVAVWHAQMIMTGASRLGDVAGPRVRAA